MKQFLCSLLVILWGLPTLSPAYTDAQNRLQPFRQQMQRIQNGLSHQRIMQAESQNAPRPLSDRDASESAKIKTFPAGSSEYKAIVPASSNQRLQTPVADPAHEKTLQ